MKAKAAIIITVSVLLISTLFSFLFFHDNKYEMNAPYGKSGNIQITEKDIIHQRVIFLIDDWEFYQNEIYNPEELLHLQPNPHYIFIGQYPNFSLMKGKNITKGTYRMVINHTKATQEIFIKIPEIFTEYSLYINGQLQDAYTGDILSLGNNEQTEILIQIHHSKHYYDGIYYPFAIGTIQAIQRMNFIQHTIYIGMAIFSLILFLFAITLRRQDKDSVFTIFAYMCLSFSLYCLYPIVHTLLSSYSTIAYRLEDFLNFLSIALLLKLCATIVKIDKHFLYRKCILPISILVVACVIIIPGLFLPNYKQLINAYGSFIDISKWISSLYLFYCAYFAFKSKNTYAIYILAGGTIFSITQLFNFFFNNLFEPIYGCWQAEYGSFIIILIYLMIVLKRNRILMKDNLILNEHLEQAIEQRTKEMEHLLEERKAFFSDVAHDLKAPLGAIQNYTRLIEQNDIHLDNEIRNYLHSIERKNQLMSERISSLQQITQLDKTKGVNEALSINKLLQSFYDENCPDADALGIHFQIQLLENDCMIYAQNEKVSILLENLFYNALSFTPFDGVITVLVSSDEEFVHIVFKDSGAGIHEDDLPHIFERFYSKRDNDSEKSGLGLYIVHMIVKELHGTISVESKLHEGTSFYIKIPLLHKVLNTLDDAFQL
ncbi:ATP-binding protein [Amedibacillus sp. YH-ame10]